MSTIGRTLKLFLADGTADGLIVSEIINWTGQIFKFPRESLSVFLGRKESARTGIYILSGIEIDTDEPVIYVGESDNVGERLRQHEKDISKSFWNSTYVINSKDYNLTKAHALYLEATIVKKSQQSQKFNVVNIKSKEYENLPESDISDMNYFLEQIYLSLPVLGLDIFIPESIVRSKAEISTINAIHDSAFDEALVLRQSPLPAITGSESIEVILSDPKHDVEARGLESNGKILVISGSRARKNAQVLTPTYKSLRESLFARGILRDSIDRNYSEFLSDYLFDSPSAASAVILGRSDNGRSSWKEVKSGKSLGQLYREQSEKAIQPMETE